jgi:hypothetical protein
LVAILSSYLKQNASREKFNSDSEYCASLMPSAETIGGGLFERDVALYERLDAMIDRAVKRLMRIKATKQIGQTGAASTDYQQTKRVT